MAGDARHQAPFDETRSLLEHCSWRTSCAGDVLDQKLAAARKFRTREIELVTSPLIYCLCRSSFIFFLLATGLYLLISGFYSLNFLLDGSFPVAHLTSIHVHGYRKSEKTTNSLEFLSMNVLTGCGNFSVLTPFLNKSVKFRVPVSIVGFTLEFNNTANCANERLFFKVEGIHENEMDVRVIGSTSVRWALDEIRFIDSGLEGCTSILIFDYRRPWPSFFGDESIGFLFLVGSALFAAGICAILHYNTLVLRVLVCSFVAASSLTFTCCVGFLSLDMAREALYPGICSLGFTVLAVWLSFDITRLLDLLVFFGLYFLVARVADDCAVHSDCAYLLRRPPAAQIVAVVLGLYYIRRRGRIIARAVAGVALDWPAFHLAWLSLLDTQGDHEALPRLRSLTDQLFPASAPCPQQYNRARPPHGPNQSPPAVRDSVHPFTSTTGAPRSSSFPGKVHIAAATFEVPTTQPGTAHSPVASFCQLYSQALCVAPLLHSACLEWALASGGRVVLDHADYIPPPLFPATLRRWMLAGLIKEPGRAIAKVLACYSGDVSYILDVCRCRIVFDRVADLARCIELVSSYESVRVVRARNGLTEEDDARLSGGFRAVVLNVCFDSELARQLGLENHVCEVQLLHSAFDVVRKAGCHANYVDFRALRGHIGTRFKFPARCNPSAVTPAPQHQPIHFAVPIDMQRPGDLEQAGLASGHWENPSSAAELLSHSRSWAPHTWESSAATSGMNTDSEAIDPSGGPPKPSLSVLLQEGWTEPRHATAMSQVATVTGRNLERADREKSPNAAGVSVQCEALVRRISLSDGIRARFGWSPMLSAEAIPSLGSLDVITRDSDDNRKDPTKGSEGVVVHIGSDIDGHNEEASGGNANHPSGQRLDSPLRAALVSAARDTYLRFTLGGSGSLDRHTSDFEVALNQSSSYSVLFSSKPLAAYASKPMGKVRTILMTAALAIAAAAFCHSAFEDGRGHLAGSLVSIRPLGLASTHSPWNASVISSFGLLEGDCHLPSSTTTFSGSMDSTMELTVRGDGAAATGYFLTINGAGWPGGGLARWVVEASDDGGSTWVARGQCVWVTMKVSTDGGSTWRLVGRESSWLVGCRDASLGVESVPVLIPESASFPTELRVDFRADKVAAWLAIGFLALPLGWAGALLASLLGQVDAFRPILVATLSVFCAWIVSWKVTTWSSDVGWRRGLHQFVVWSVTPAVCSAIGFHFLERRLVLVFLIDGFLFILGFTLARILVYSDDVNAALAEDVPWTMTLALGVYLALGAVVFFWLRFRVLRRAQQLIEEDQRRYDAIWAEVVRLHFPSCIALKELVAEIGRALPAGNPHQMTLSSREGKAGGWWQRQWQWTTGMLFRAAKYLDAAHCRGIQVKDAKLEKEQPAEMRDELTGVAEKYPNLRAYPLFSLDQLFVQAMCVQPILLKKVREWAKPSSGMFPYRRAEGTSRFARLSDEEEIQISDFKFCSLKAVPRAVEKVIRSYSQDVSRLLDVCRQAVVFEHLADISKCLRIISTDPDVAILRIKNRLDPEYVSDLSGGYRDINLNVRFTSALAVKLGIETHVCELQLMLREMAELKSDKGHRHYVESRNLKAD